MSDLMGTLSSDSEAEDTTQINNDEDDSEEEEGMNPDFEFSSSLGGDGTINYHLGTSAEEGGDWSFRSALEILKQTENQGKVEKLEMSNLVAAARAKLNKGAKKQEEEESDEDDESDDDSKNSGSDYDDDDESEVEDDGVDDTELAAEMEADVLVQRTAAPSESRKSKEKGVVEVEAPENETEGSDEDEESSGDEEEGSGDSSGSEEESKSDDDEEYEKQKAKNFFDETQTTYAKDDDDETLFTQLSLSRPLLRGVASCGFVNPTKIQAAVIPSVTAGRDVCASAVTGSGKTAAFLLPIMERILHRSAAVSATRAMILTPTRELAAQCLSMMVALAKFTNIRGCLIVGGSKNNAAQAAELRTRPDVIIATPGRILDHIINATRCVYLDDLEFLVLDEADRLLDMGFSEEVMEIVNACPKNRQTLLFSATMDTKVDDLIALSLKRPVRVKVSEKRKSEAEAGVEVALRLEQEFIRIRSGNECMREAMLLALLTRTFTNRVIVFFDTKVLAHRLMVICGLCGIKCGELHGNLTQTQRLETLESFREGEISVLLATDLAARGLDISSVDAVLNFEMPSNTATYVHRIGRTARAGRGGSSCTLIGEGRRHLMKEVIRDAEEKRRKAVEAGHDHQSGVIRSRTIPAAVINHFVSKIKTLEPHIKEVLEAEAVAKMDRIAEMEMVKAENMIKYSNEINARPAKEWFQSNAQKQAIAKKAAEQAAKKDKDPSLTGLHRMTRKKRRMREARETLAKHQEEMRQEAEENGRTAKISTEQSIKKSARSAKKREHEKSKENQNLSAIDEDTMLEEKQRRKKKKPVAEDSLGTGGLFDEERVAFQKKKTTSEETVNKQVSSSYDFRGYDPNKRFGKGGRKGNKSFKSKAKYKRR